MNKSTRVSLEESVVGSPTLKTPLEKARHSNQAENAKASAPLPISREDLLAIATDLKNGHINREEATHRFIERVVDNSINNKLTAKDKEILTNAINQFFAEDQDFVQSLEKNLANLI
jgi:predicted nucleic-acid-binding protein